MSDNTAQIDTLCHALETLDQAETLEGAKFRQQAQDVLASPSVALRLKTAIADLLMQANQRFALKTVKGEESY
ncbi:MAG: hypothetical protein VKJ27_09660 [Synechocystis sp.]|jgi:hypothetical protein|nr:hypothetical protein [Synechocystis sp.]